MDVQAMCSGEGWEKADVETDVALKSEMFGRVPDLSVEDYITATASNHPIYMLHKAGRYQARRFRKAQYPIIERLTNSLMMRGRNNAMRSRRKTRYERVAKANR